MESQTGAGLVCWSRSGQFLEINDLVNPTEVAVGDKHVRALDDDGVVCWGYNVTGATTVPASVSNVVKLSAGGEHTCTLNDKGIVACWGTNSRYQSFVPFKYRF